MDKYTSILIYSESREYAEKVYQWASTELHAKRLLQKRPRVLRSLDNVSNDSNNLLFFLATFMDKQERAAIETLRLSHPKLKVVLCSKSCHSTDAWELDAFHFLPYELTHFGLLKAYRKAFANNHAAVSDNILKIRYEGMIQVLDTRKILYLKADGNYCDIICSDGRKIVLTRQLGQMAKLLEGNPAIVRVLKSLIINLDTIKSIGQNQVEFQAEKPTVIKELSERYVTEIRKQLKRHFGI